MFVKHFATFAILLALGQTINADYDATAYCQLVKPNTKLGSIDSCQKYYVCQNNVAVEQSCSSTQSYDKNAQTCKPSAQVQCYYGLENVCVGKNNEFVPDIGTCGGYIWCVNNAVSGKGSCGTGMIFDNGECSYDPGNCTPNTGDPQADLQSVCQIMPNNLYFGSTLDCNIWQVCYGNNEMNEGICTKTLVFDVATGGCIYEKTNTCDRVTGETTVPGDTTCDYSTDTVKGDPSKCSVYLTCSANNKWIKTSCPNGQYWDVTSKVCVARKAATPVSTCDRCEFSKQTFVNAVDNTCRGYYVCKDGVKQPKTENQCNVEYYLNEGAQTCSPDSSLEKYSETNGACAGYSSNPTTVGTPTTQGTGPTSSDDTTDGTPTTVDPNAETPTTADPNEDTTTTEETTTEETTTVEE